MPTNLRITLAVAAICTVPMATAVLAADHRDGTLIADDRTIEITDGKNVDDPGAPSEPEAINTWRKTRNLLRRTLVIPRPSGHMRPDSFKRR